MAFHVACPITCRRICFCTLGFPRDLLVGGKPKTEGFLNEVSRIEELLRDPSLIRARKGGSTTVQVLVPKVAPPLPPPPPITIHLPPLSSHLHQSKPVVGVGDGDGDGANRLEDSVAATTAQSKRAALQKKADAAKVAAEDYARKVELGDVVNVTKDGIGDEQYVSNVNVFCRMCFLGEKEGSERARRMLSCKICGKKYHRSCLKAWAQHRDLFHWSSWTCPSCRICEICHKVGDPSKFMFCRRCDGAYHCYCQHPPHKNVSSGPYLCPKHTRCHSCGSNVPGNGLSVRWFLGYTCCDACGRLFVKGNYCPVCLKVYRDSESTPMVCCDTCQRWVHCNCDNISDQKYLQFQVDGNLQYKCATCRGECYQVKDLEDAVQELWRRRDETDQVLIASLRAGAGLPTQEEIFVISPFSDDEDNGPSASKNDLGRSLKLSLKGLIEKSPKKSRDNGKKPSKKKNAKKKASSADKDEHHEFDINGQLVTTKTDDLKSNDKVALKPFSSNVAGIVNHDGVCSVNPPPVLKHKLVNEVMVGDGERVSRIVKLKSKGSNDLEGGDDNLKDSRAKLVKTKKLVINLGPRKLNVSSPRSDTSSCRREQDLTASNGSGDIGNRRVADADAGDTKYDDGDADDNSNQMRAKVSRKEGKLMKFGRFKSESSNIHPKGSSLVQKAADGGRLHSSSIGQSQSFVSGKIMIGSKQTEEAFGESNDDHEEAPPLKPSSKDSKFSLKLKIKKPSLETQNNRTVSVEEEKSSSIRGQRSKRKRSSNFSEKFPFRDSKAPRFDIKKFG